MRHLEYLSRKITFRRSVCVCACERERGGGGERERKRERELHLDAVVVVVLATWKELSRLFTLPCVHLRVCVCACVCVYEMSFGTLLAVASAHC